MVKKHPSSLNDKLSLSLKIFSPKKTYFDGDAHSVSARNATGPFDILPKHHNFITLLGAGTITVNAVMGSRIETEIEQGIMHVKDNVVTIFLDV